ncbi:MAG: UDP-N-acetylmuramate dehydrogenase [Negativicutes bacterium]
MEKNKLSRSVLQEIQNSLPSTRMLFSEPLAKYTTFKIGGPADCIIFPSSVQDVAAVLSLTNKQQVPLTILGNGSNVLVLDGGIRGVVLKFDKDFAGIRHEGARIIAGAGALLSDVSAYASKQGLTGFEFAIGIPGSVGGAVFMNAGAYESDMSCVVNSVTAVSPLGEVKRFSRQDIVFRYRHSVFQENHYVVCEVEIDLQKGENNRICQKMNELTIRRESKQPIELPSAGSTFKRPPGQFAGTLIDQAGLKGLKIGGAQVSGKHAGFVVNAGGATAQDVLTLIQEVQRRVQKQFGVLLQPEVRVLGEESDH